MHIRLKQSWLYTCTLTFVTGDGQTFGYLSLASTFGGRDNITFTAIKSLCLHPRSHIWSHTYSIIPMFLSLWLVHKLLTFNSLAPPCFDQIKGNMMRKHVLMLTHANTLWHNCHPSFSTRIFALKISGSLPSFTHMANKNLEFVVVWKSYHQATYRWVWMVSYKIFV